MSVDEIASEPSSGAWGRRWAVVAVVVVAGLVWFALSSPPSNPQRGLSGSPIPSTSAPAPEPQRPGVADAELVFGELCSPVVADDRLTLTFTLINPTPVDLVLLSIEPDLPSGGLTLEASAIFLDLGPCGRRGGQIGSLEGGRVPAGGVLLATFVFGLPESCPWPIPVGAAVISRVFDVSQSGSRYVIPLYADLEGIDFDTCS